MNTSLFILYSDMLQEDSFKKKLETALQRSPSSSENKLWVDVALYSVIILVVVCLYYFVQQGNFTYRITNRAIADVGMLLIGLSMALSGLCYFWNFADRFIIYRKHLGVAGFAYALAHSVLSLFFMPEYFPFPDYYLEQNNLLSFLSALTALLIYAGMTLISNRYAIKELGGKIWRNLLRIGYIAYFLTIIHFGLRGYPFWLRWFIGQSDTVFPSFGLIVFTFGTAVLLIRIALWFALIQKKNSVTIETNEASSITTLQKS